MIILLTANFISSLEPELLKDFINSFDEDIEVRVLRFTVEMLNKKNFDNFKKLYLLPNVKFVDISTSYSYVVDKDSDFIKVDFCLQKKSDGKNEKNIYSVDNDVVIRYLASNVNENIVVATNVKSLIVSCRRLRKNVLFMYKNKYVLTNDDMFNSTSNKHHVIVDSEFLIQKFDKEVSGAVKKDCMYIILNAVVYEIADELFLKLLYLSNNDRNIVIEISSSFVSEDFLHSDIYILVESMLRLKKGNAILVTANVQLCVESNFANTYAMDYDNFVSANFSKLSDVHTVVEKETSSLLFDEVLALDEDTSDESNSTEKNVEIENYDSSIKDGNVTQTSDNLPKTDVFKTLRFRIEKGMAIVDAITADKIENIYNSNGTLAVKETIPIKKGYALLIKPKQFIKFKDEDFFYELITLRAKDNLRKTDKTLESFS